MAHESKIVAARLCWRNAVTLAVLPHIATIAGHGVGAVVKVLAVQPAYGAVEVPIAFLVL